MTFLVSDGNFYLRAMRILFFFIFSVFFFASISSCKKENVYPIEPVIEMSDRQQYQSPSMMIVSFTDGDGDVGFAEGDTLYPYNYTGENGNKYYYNLLLYYFEKIDDEWVPVELAINYFYRVPYLTPTGQNKSLKGEIEVAISLPANRPDSIRFEIELIDRALNESNMLTSGVIYK